MHGSILRIERHAARRDANDVWLFLLARWVVGGQQERFVAKASELATEGLNRRRNAIDAREVNVGNEQYAHRKRGVAPQSA